ncbi:MAG: helix-turn-helix domain-containing protein [Candidatus Omnitrophota bacterium]
MISAKIVVIDNDPRIIKSIRLGLPEYEIVSFIDPRDGLDYLMKPNSADLVILDVKMPHIDGITVLSEIKARRKKIMVIMMTAFGSKDVALKSLRSRADDFIEKPFFMAELKLKVSDLLQAKSYEENSRLDKDDQIERVKRFIERNYDNANLESIADEMCLSPRYLSRMFNDKNEMSFRDYKRKVKMDKAKELLVKTHRTVSEIATELGYQSPGTFMRQFKQAVKVTPTEYRRSHNVEDVI